MMIMDTHIWIWRTHNASELSSNQKRLLQENETSGLGVSIISCWEVAKLVSLGRLDLPLPVEEWLAKALAYPGTRLLDLTSRIVVGSNQLSDSFHRDPADQLIVATARVLKCPLVTVDQKIRAYPHVMLVD